MTTLPASMSPLDLPRRLVPLRRRSPGLRDAVAWSLRGCAGAGTAILLGLPALAAAAEPARPAPLQPPLPDVGLSLLRVFGALAVVLGVFLGGVWLFRNWQRLALRRGRAPRLNVLEARSLGGRHALYVVGYNQDRFLVAASPSGVSLLSHLQPADEPPAETADAVRPSFARALARRLPGK
jgi:flagellar biogenesis protein FliO